MARKLNEQKFCSWCGQQVKYKTEWMSQCPNCGYERYITNVPSTNNLVVSGGKVMIVKRAIDPAKGKYDLPGGFMDTTDTTIEDCVYRELKEELGLDKSDFKPPKYLGSKTPTYEFHDSDIPCLDLYFICELDGKSPDEIAVDQTENSRLLWVKKEDLDKFDFYMVGDKQMLIKYFEGNDENK